MIKFNHVIFTSVLLFLFNIQFSKAQNSNQMGAWYMYFYDTQFKESKFGIQVSVTYLMTTDTEPLKIVNFDYS